MFLFGRHSGERDQPRWHPSILGGLILSSNISDKYHYFAFYRMRDRTFNGLDGDGATRQLEKKEMGLCCGSSINDSNKRRQGFGGGGGGG